MAHVFGERTLATLERLLGLLSAFEVVVWMTDGWPLYESRLKGKLHVISKRYTQRIERHNPIDHLNGFTDRSTGLCNQISG